MMKNYSLLIWIMISFIAGFSQDQPDIEEITNSGKYIFGLGTGSTYEEARANAMDDLISQISVQVESYFTNKTVDTGEDVETYAKSVVKTYSNVSLVSASSLTIEERKNSYKVLRYIGKSDMDRIFENRRLKILEYVKAGLSAEDDLRIGDALKNYYWALVLLQSHKYHDRIFFNFPEEGDRMLHTWLPDKINDIFSDLDFQVNSVEYKPEDQYKAIYLNISYNDKPVDFISYTYWTGKEHSTVVDARSGQGIVELTGESCNQLDRLKLSVEYEYANKINYDPDVKAVFSHIDFPTFDRAEFAINLMPSGKTDDKLVNKERMELAFQQINKVEKYRKARKSISDVVDAIQLGTYNEIAEYFTPEGWLVFNKLIANGNVKVLPMKDTLNFISIDNNILVRSVPMKFSYKTNKRDFIEQVVFTFDGNLLIDAISFAISDQAIHDIASKSERFGSVEDKYHLINFMELYKTAYCLKRLDLIESIFADNALIIVGNVVKDAESIEGMYAKIGSDRVKYVELSKSEYINRLRTVFNTNEFVNIHFEDNLVKKVNGNSKIYGIQIKQDYFSSTYSDKGYLFLMIDLNDSINPKIYVRTWQPEKNPDGSIFGLNDFLIN